MCLLCELHTEHYSPADSACISCGTQYQFPGVLVAVIVLTTLTLLYYFASTLILFHKVQQRGIHPGDTTETGLRSFQPGRHHSVSSALVEDVGAASKFLLVRRLSGGMADVPARRPQAVRALLHMKAAFFTSGATAVASWNYVRHQLNQYLRVGALQPKLKAVWGFYQVAVLIPSVYHTPLPLSVQRWLDSISIVFDIDVSALQVPLQCMGLEGYLPRLLFWMCVPVVLALIGLVVAFCGAVRTHLRAKSTGNASAVSMRSLSKEAVYVSLPFWLLVMFVFCPMVASEAFSAFDCDLFDDGRAFMWHGLDSNTRDHKSTLQT